MVTIQESFTLLGVLLLLAWLWSTVVPDFLQILESGTRKSIENKSKQVSQSFDQCSIKSCGYVIPFYLVLHPVHYAELKIMGILEDYPYCKDIIESKFLPLLSDAARKNLYVRTHNDKMIFENILYTNHPGKAVTPTRRQSANPGMHMRAKDFLASISAFADFSDEQLCVLEQKATVKTFAANDVIFKQGDDGDVFYVINKGAVDVLIQDNPQAMKKGDLGRIVNRLTEGCYFGERALMTAEKRAASIRCIKDTVCLVFSRAVYEELISGSSALIGEDNNVNIDWSRDHETRSLFRHIENILNIHNNTAISPKLKRILYELTTNFTPELTVDEIMSRMVNTVKVALKVDRVGFF
ncbi:MAG: cyclic nucleotide-binding domain-containing protein, partial [Sphingobacteriales bacterium]